MNRAFRSSIRLEKLPVMWPKRHCVTLAQTDMRCKQKNFWQLTQLKMAVFGFDVEKCNSDDIHRKMPDDKAMTSITWIYKLPDNLLPFFSVEQFTIHFLDQDEKQLCSYFSLSRRTFIL